MQAGKVRWSSHTSLGAGSACGLRMCLHAYRCVPPTVLHGCGPICQFAWPGLACLPASGSPKWLRCRAVRVRGAVPHGQAAPRAARVAGFKGNRQADGSLPVEKDLGVKLLARRRAGGCRALRARDRGGSEVGGPGQGQWAMRRQVLCC